jgi:hypothetical protein
LWIVTAVTRSTISAPDTSRYVYLGAVVVVLLGVELLGELAPAPRAIAVAAAGVLVLYFALSGLTAMHNGAAGLRSTSQTLTAELGAMEEAAAYVAPTFQPDPSRAPQIVAGPYLHTVHAIGSSPADTPTELVTADAASRTVAESMLIRIEGVALAPIGSRVALSALHPLLAGVSGSPPTRLRRCWSTTATGPGSYTEFIVPAHGLLVRAGGEAADVAVRRFAPPLGGVDLGVVAPHASSLVRFPVDGSGRPWFARVSSGTPSEVCGVG